MLEISPANARLWSMLGSRGTLGVALLDAAASAPEMMVLSADLCVTAGLDRFRSTYPDRFVNVGIAEQNMLGIACGLAHDGRNVFVTTFSTFAAMRAYEQVRVHLGYMQANVKVVGLAAGLAMGQFGNTHYGIEDAALMRAVPGLTVVAPADGAEVVKTVQALADHRGPAYIRLTGAMNNPIVYREDYPFAIGTAVELVTGSDIAIFAAGTMVHESLIAAEKLRARGISSSVIDMHTLKPLDTAAIDRACGYASAIVTVEEHGIVGGLGAAIAEYTATRGGAPRQLFIGLPDEFGKNGDYAHLLTKYGLRGDMIAERVTAFLTHAGRSAVPSTAA